MVGAREVDQVPDRARLGHRRGGRSAGDRGFRAWRQANRDRAIPPAAPVPTGPGGEEVSDSFYFVHQPLAGNSSITARATSLTGQIPVPTA